MSVEGYASIGPAGSALKLVEVQASPPVQTAQLLNLEIMIAGSDEQLARGQRLENSYSSSSTGGIIPRSVHVHFHTAVELTLIWPLSCILRCVVVQ